MKPFRSTIILLGVLLFLLLVFVFFASDSAEKKRNTSLIEKPLLSDRQLKRIDHVVISPDQGESVTLFKKNDTWFLDDVLVDRDEQEKLYEVLKTLSIGKVVSKSRDNWSKYGLSEETSSVALMSGEETVAIVFLGSVGPDYQSHYVRHEGKDTVHLVKTDLVDFLHYEINRWKNKHLVHMNTNDIRSFTVRVGDDKWTFEKQSRDWKWIVAGTLQDIDPKDAFQTYFDALVSLKADGIEADESKFSIADNAIAFSMDDGREHIISIDVGENESFVRITDQPDLLRFSSDVTTRLRPEFLKKPEVSPEPTEETSLSTEMVSE